MSILVDDNEAEGFREPAKARSIEPCPRRTITTRKATRTLPAVRTRMATAAIPTRPRRTPTAAG